MQKLPRLLVACALALSSVYALGQDKSDYFGQSPQSGEQAAPAATAMPAPQRRVVITNADDEELDNQQRQQARPGDPARMQPGAADAAGRRSAPYSPMQDEYREPTEFQKFIRDSTGKLLPVFGADFFRNAPSTFSAIGGTPVPADYPLGSGDELFIRGWGSIDINYKAKIDRNGMISIPTVGSVVLAGVRAGDAEAVIRRAVARLYKGVTINVNFGQLRAITVYVVGQAKRPGTYTVSSLSTLVTAVFASGGPNSNGSLRRIQVKRGADIVADLDLYAFIARGDKSADIKLRDGDTILIPAAKSHAALTGKVNSPAIYELRGENDTIESVLEFAGGMPVVADPRRAFLERIDSSRSQPRSIEQFVLDGAGLRRTLKNGDVLNVTSITPDFSNAVVLRGNVDQPVRVPFTPGMRVSDLIPSRAYLITRSSINRQNNVLSTSEEKKDRRLARSGNGNDNGYANGNGYGNLRDGEREPGNETRRDEFEANNVMGEKADTIAARIGGLIDEINWDYAVVERINRSDLTVSLIPFNLGKVFSAPAGKDNVQLQAGDTVTVFSQQDVAVPMDKRRVFVRIEGEVNIPGVYQMNAGESLHSLMARAGGPTVNAYLFGTAFYREKVRMEQEANLEKATRRLEAQLANEQSKLAANTRSTADAVSAEARRQAAQMMAKESIARMRELKPTGRIALGLDPKERSFSRLPGLKLENGDRLVVPAKAEFVHVFGAVNAESSPLWRPNGRVSDYLDVVGLTADADRSNIFILRVDGSVVSRDSGKWRFGGFGGVEVMPGDNIVVPEKLDKETSWTKFTQGTREWAQIFANFGLGAAALKVLKE